MSTPRTKTMTIRPYLAMAAAGALLTAAALISAPAAYAQDAAAEAPAAAAAGDPDTLLLPGFVDAHVHYPQTAIIASWGRRLIDWLNTYTFPEEGKCVSHH